MILNEEQTLIRDTARAFAKDRLLPNDAAWDREKKNPRAVFSEMGELGRLGILAPG
ncbi:MAG: acyl-CoA dehydrogenase family protein, partial [Rhodospirillaceae bacterium]|nr:acyl-CoA dehydrogenase family protein [Rhodospirillaceae bacterium]